MLMAVMVVLVVVVVNLSFRQWIIFAIWCKSNFLNLNIKRSKDVGIDFEVKKDHLVLINDQPVEVVQNYKYSSSIIDDKLEGRDIVQRIYKNAYQRLFCVL